MTSPFVLARREPSVDAVRAGYQSNPDAINMSVTSVYTAMLSSQEPPSEAELRELSRMMWGDKPYWARPDLPKSQPTEALCQEDIARMRAFIAALGATNAILHRADQQKEKEG